MKSYSNPNTSLGTDPRLVPVRFEFTDASANTVCVAGPFNQGRLEARTLHHAGGGRWLKEMALAPGTYEYSFVVDGQWMPDPFASETVPDAFGGRISILKVTDATKPSARATQKLQF